MNWKNLILVFAVLMIIAMPIATPTSTPQAQAGGYHYNSSYYWYNWEWTSNWDRIYVKTWYPGDYDAFDYSGHRWNLMRTTKVCVAGYVCEPGYVRVKYWYDPDLTRTFMMCPCGRVFYYDGRYRW